MLDSSKNRVASKFNTGEKIMSGWEFSKPLKVAFSNSDKAKNLLDSGLRRVKELGAKVVIHADVDFDGIASAYIVYSAVTSIVGRSNVIMTINKERKHGIQDRFVDVVNGMCNGAGAGAGTAVGAGVALVIVVDSSTNNLEQIKSLMTDVIVLDHHELEINVSDAVGKTKNGEYAIVNSMIDNVLDFSGAEVCYEWLRYNGFEAFLEQKRLYSWVTVSLFSDVINTDNERNQWYIQQLLIKGEIEETLEKMFKSLYERISYSKTSISFSLVPLINAAIRLGHSTDVLNYVINRPAQINELKVLKQIQKNRVEEAMSQDNISSRVESYRDFILYDMEGMEELKGFEGLIASKINDNEKTAVAFNRTETGIKGSFRVKGVLSKLDVRKELMETEGMSASGHREAFGFEISNVGALDAVERLKSKLSELCIIAEHIEAVSDGAVVYIDVFDKSEFDELKRNFELIAAATINSRMASDKKILLRIENLPKNVTVGSDNSVSVFGMGVTSFIEVKPGVGYLLLYPEMDNGMTLYVDGVIV